MWAPRTLARPLLAMIRTLLICAAVMEATFVLLHLARDRSEQVAFVLLSYLVSSVAFAWLLWQLRRPHPQSPARWTITVVVVAGVAFRLTLLPLPPATSPDVNRYLWEGVVQRLGFNPYVSSPNAPELAPVAEAYPALAEAVSQPSVHPHIAAVYPPVTQALFLVNAVLFDGALFGWKLILLVFDGLLASALWVVLKGRSAATAGLAAVFWCPLLLLESYEGAHLDLIGAALLVLAIVAMERRHPIVAGVALGLAINVKYLWPLLLLILLIRPALGQRRCLAFITVAVVVAVICWVPYRSGIASALATARYFAEHWTFNDVIFEALRYLPGPRWLPMSLVLAVLIGLAVCLAWRRTGDIWADAWLLSGTALLLSPVAYPWYFLWIVPGLAVRAPIWLVVWVLSVPALHLVDWHYVATGQWDAMPWLWLIVDGVPAVLLIKAWRGRLRSTI